MESGHDGAITARDGGGDIAPARVAMASDERRTVSWGGAVHARRRCVARGGARTVCAVAITSVFAAKREVASWRRHGTISRRRAPTIVCPRLHGRADSRMGPVLGPMWGCEWFADIDFECRAVEDSDDHL